MTIQTVSKVVVASRNAKKLDEMLRILRPLVPGIEVLGLDDVAPFDEPVENELTFEGNALIKARATLAATGLPSLADDSGLCVDALNGMPGVLSARWAGTAKDDVANNRLLLEQLDDFPDDVRTAQFRCTVAFCGPDLASGGVLELVQDGVMPGRLLRTPEGLGGFGYDPLFVPDGEVVSSASLTRERKDELSHRGKALRTIAPRLAAALG